MGMFDDIIVPKSYLKGLLTKDQEKLLKTTSRFGGSVRGIVFQTKSLDNCLRKYKIYRQKLFVNSDALWNCEPPDTEARTEDTPKKYPYEKGRWEKVSHTGEVIFYDGITDKKGNRHWVEFRFVFNNGVLDSKRLEDFSLSETSEEIEEENKKWEAARAKQTEYENTTTYKFYFFLFKVFHKITNRIRKKVTRHDYDYGTKEIK